MGLVQLEGSAMAERKVGGILSTSEWKPLNPSSNDGPATRRSLQSSVPSCLLSMIQRNVGIAGIP